MIKEKFEEKTGCEISDTEFEIIQLCYNHSSHTERRFAQLWKGNSQDIIAETLRKINDNLNKYQSELRYNQDSIKRNSIELQMTRNRIELLNNKILKICDSIYKDYSNCKELQMAVSEFFDNNRIIIWKLENNIQLSGEEIELIKNSINQNNIKQ